ncbi:MAG: aldehyde dehydrogenase family protein [Woeseia sp.]
MSPTGPHDDANTVAIKVVSQKMSGGNISAATNATEPMASIMNRLKRSVFRSSPVRCIPISLLALKPASDRNVDADDSIYGLAGAVWSTDINTAHKVAAAVRVGTMGINNYFGGDITVPFGGFKQSGNGRDKSMHALR